MTGISSMYNERNQYKNKAVPNLRIKKSLLPDSGHLKAPTSSEVRASAQKKFNLQQALDE